MNSTTKSEKKAPLVCANAGEFNKGFLEKLEGNSMYKILIEHFNYYFFSHQQNVKLQRMETSEVISHYYDFFLFACSGKGGEQDVSRAYAAYYVDYYNISKNYRRK